MDGFFSGKPYGKRMMTRGTPMTQETSISMEQITQTPQGKMMANDAMKPYLYAMKHIITIYLTKWVGK